ncbi:MAG TPA: condensation domain-containing protein, partial [Polyangiaceae bacterium]|nr:condensation domain-containing protein [Polyangiaceae bacterium]
MPESRATNDKSVDYDPFAGPAILSTAPCTEPQRELWTSCQLGDDASLAFNESVSVWLRGALDEEALRAALADLCARHEALNITFPAGGTTFEVHPSGACALVRHDWSGLESAQREQRLAALRARVVTEPFDLTNGPLFRVELAVLSPTEHVLTLTAHHIVVDGWSTAVLVHDLAALYSARVTRTPAQLPAAERFSTYARTEAERASSGEFAVHEAYWTGQFSGEIPVLELPADHPRPPVKTYASAREDLKLDAALVSTLKKVGAKERTSLFVTLMAAFEVLLHRIAG